MPKARLLIIVPTRNRPQNVAKVEQAWADTDAFDHADLLFVADEDDAMAGGYRDAFRDFGSATPAMELWSAEWKPLVPKLNWAATASRWMLSHYFAIGFAGDDHLPRTRGWAARYLEALDDLGTGIVYGDDGYQHERLPTQWAMTADIVRTLGRMVPAPVDHLYCDNAIQDLGVGLNRLRYLPDVLIEHMHPVARKAASDEQYARVNSRAQYRKDGERYVNWLASPYGFAADLEKLRPLLRTEE